MRDNLYLLAKNLCAREGDLVLVRATGRDGAYRSVEAPDGSDVPLHEGSTFVAVLGTRRSGVNVIGRLPSGTLSAGDPLSVLSAAGLVGYLEHAPRYLGGQALPVEVLGFPSMNGRPANLRDAPSCGRGPARSGHANPVVVVAGTSAECGKTTCMVALIAVARRRWPERPVAAVKATGTGRLQDVNRYRAAGAAYVRDFVDLGFCSTYNMTDQEFADLLDELLDPPMDTSLLLIELGGDLLEARVPDALACMGRLHFPVVLCVNDALGATAGITVLKEAGVDRLEVAALRVNPLALAARLGRETVVDLGSPPAVEELLDRWTG